MTREAPHHLIDEVSPEISNAVRNTAREEVLPEQAAANVMQREREDLRARLQEAEETLSAIRNGEVDALVVSGQQGAKVYTLQSAEQPYRVLIEQMQEGAATLSPEGVILYCNLRLAELLRTPHEKVLAASLSAFVPASDKSLFDSLLEAGKGQGSKAELHLCAGDGTLVPVYLTLSLLPSEENNVCLVVTDLTEQKRNEETVAAERLARSILENTAEAVVVCDTQGNVLRTSYAAQVLCGQNPLRHPFAKMFPLHFPGTDHSSMGSLDSESSEGESLKSDIKGEGMFPPDPSADLPGLGFPLSLTLQGETLQGIEAHMRRADGEIFFLLLTAGPLRADQNVILGCVLTLTNITELKNNQLEIEILNDRLRRAVQETHHRVKNNLQIVSALAEMQMEDSTDPLSSAALRRISQHTRSLAAIHDLLTLQSKVNVEADTISTKDTMDKLIPLLQATAGGKRIFSAADAIALSIQQIGSLCLLVNELVSNAVKHGEGTIDVTLVARGNRVRLEVANGGPGFPPGFDPRTAANTGLDLIDATGRYDLHGTISFENRPEGGARVIVDFPIL